MPQIFRYIGAIWFVLLLIGCNRIASPVISASPAQEQATRIPITATPLSKETVSPSPTPTLTLSPASPSPTPLPPTQPSSGTKTIKYSPWELVLALAWSGDGKILAVASGNHVLVYESPSLNETHRLDIGAWSSQLAFQPGSNLLALTALDGSVQLWEAEHGNLVCRIPAHNKGANSLAFSPDGKILASAGNDAIVRLWDLTSLTETCELPIIAEMIGGAFAVPDIAFSPDGNLIASVDLRLIRLRDPTTERLTATLRGEASIFDIEFSPDGLLLAAGETNNTTTLWDIQTGQAQRQFIQPGNPKTFIWSLTFSPDGKVLATGSSDGSIILWELETGEILRVLTEHSSVSGDTRPITSLAFNPGGNWLASGDLNATLRLWTVGE